MNRSKRVRAFVSCLMIFVILFGNIAVFMKDSVTVYAGTAMEDALLEAFAHVDKDGVVDVSSLNITADTAEGAEFKSTVSNIIKYKTGQYWVNQYGLSTLNNVYNEIRLKAKDVYLNEDDSINWDMINADVERWNGYIEAGQIYKVMEERVYQMDTNTDNMLVYLTDLMISYEDSVTLQAYMNDLAASHEDFYWIDTVRAYGKGDYTTYLKVYIKEEYKGSSIDKAGAKVAYQKLNERLDNGEWKDIILERLGNVLSINDYVVDISDLQLSTDKSEEIKELFYDTIVNYGEYYWMKGLYLSASNNKLTALRITGKTSYKVDYVVNELHNKDVIIGDYMEFRDRLSSLFYQLDDDMTDLEKILAVHEWIVRETEYDYGNYLTGTIPDESYSYDGLFMNSLYVCSGYAAIMELLLSAMGIEITTVASDSMDHAWNVVNIDGNYYHIDATWNDLGKDDKNEGRHTADYFVKSDEEMENLRHYGWVSDVTCTKKDSYKEYIFRTYNGISSNSYNYYKGDWYYKTDYNVISKSQIDGSGAAEFATFDESIVNMYIYMDYMYVATDSKVYKINMANLNDTEIVFEVETDSDEIEEFVIKNDMLKIDASDESTSVSLIQGTELSLKESDIEVSVGSRRVINYDLISPVGAKVEWLSSDRNVVTVSEDGKITGISEGVATVYAYVDGIRKECKVTVKEATFTYADLDNSGKVDVIDAVIVKRMLAGLDSDINFDAADVNVDGIVSVLDAVEIMKYIAGVEVEFGKAS